MTYHVPAAALDPRPDDTILFRREDAWQVLTVRELIAAERLLPLGERGSRAFVPESVQLDSAPAQWRGEVLLLVDLHPDRFASAAEAREALAAGWLGAPVGPVLIPAASLTGDVAELVGAGELE